MPEVRTPFETFRDTAGSPLDAGFVYIGLASQDPILHPATVYWDEAMTIPATQPIRTVQGYPSRGGAAAALFTASDYSVMVKDRKGQIVYSAASVAALTPATGVSVKAPYTGGELTTIYEVNARTINLYDTLTPTERADVGALTHGVDVTTKIQAVIDEAGRRIWQDNTSDIFDNGGWTIVSPPGIFRTSARLDVLPGVSIQGAGKTATVFWPVHDGAVFRNVILEAPAIRYNTGGHRFSNFTIRGDHTKANQIGIDMLRPVNCTFENLYLLNLGGDGLSIRQGVSNTLLQVDAQFCGGAGIHLGRGVGTGAIGWPAGPPYVDVNVYPSNNNQIIDCHGRANDGAGLLLDGLHNGTLVRGGAYEANYLAAGDNQGYNIEIRGGSFVPTVLDGCWFEGNVKAHIYINASDISVPVQIVRISHQGAGAAGNVDRCLIVDAGFVTIDKAFGHAGAYKTIAGSNSPFRINKAGGAALLRVTDCYGSLVTDENFVEDETGAHTGLTAILIQDNWGSLRKALKFKTDNNLNGGIPMSFQHEVQAHPWFAINQNAQRLAFLDAATGAIDTEFYRVQADLLGLAPGDGFYLDGTWNGGHWLMGTYHMWVSAAGKLYIKNGIPANDTDGTVIGTQA